MKLTRLTVTVPPIRLHHSACRCPQPVKPLVLLNIRQMLAACRAHDAASRSAGLTMRMRPTRTRRDILIACHLRINLGPGTRFRAGTNCDSRQLPHRPMPCVRRLRVCNFMADCVEHFGLGHQRHENRGEREIHRHWTQMGTAGYSSPAGVRLDGQVIKAVFGRF